MDEDAVELGCAGAEAAFHVRGDIVGGGKGQIAVDDAVEADQRRPAHMRQAQVVHIGHHRKFREYAVHGGAHIMEIRVEGQGVFRSAEAIFRLDVRFFAVFVFSVEVGFV